MCRFKNYVIFKNNIIISIDILRNKSLGRIDRKIGRLIIIFLHLGEWRKTSG